MGDLTCKDCFVYVKVLQYIYQKDNQVGPKPVFSPILLRPVDSQSPPMKVKSKWQTIYITLSGQGFVIYVIKHSLLCA